MKIAVIGSRTLTVRNLEKYIPKDTTEIISGGANGIDRCAKEFAVKNNIRYTEFLPEYKIHGRYAPLKRNLEIIDNADFVLAFWDGKSRCSFPASRPPARPDNRARCPRTAR